MQKQLKVPQYLAHYLIFLIKVIHIIFIMHIGIINTVLKPVILGFGMCGVAKIIYIVQKDH